MAPSGSLSSIYQYLLSRPPFSRGLLNAKISEINFPTHSSFPPPFSVSRVRGQDKSTPALPGEISPAPSQSKKARFDMKCAQFTFTTLLFLSGCVTGAYARVARIQITRVESPTFEAQSFG